MASAASPNPSGLTELELQQVIRPPTTISGSPMSAVSTLNCPVCLEQMSTTMPPDADHVNGPDATVCASDLRHASAVDFAHARSTDIPATTLDNPDGARARATAATHHASAMQSASTSCREEALAIGILPCEHAFHRTCIRQWLLTRPTCPVCRCHFGDHHDLVVHESD